MSARCYCGASQLAFSKSPATVAYCHCTDCRRWTGAPVAAFAAFERTAVTGDLDAPYVTDSGVERWSCATCRSPLAACFPYLPDQIYVPVGLFDQIETLVPKLHSHADNTLTWLHIDDDLPRAPGTARDVLNRTTA
ncbi:GFA family protein [uncultured Tateyamaria sp.]|uniref:GFA family protein n=1 Tax=uncultured Tateyamaria sp. TaxID=455651 RepID=UPI00260C5FD3|nr:GFA family protein [uncultured Tateyamaria sp.]